MNTSATQLETLDLCRRKWLFKYVMKMPEIQKGSTEFGTAFHARAALFLQGKDPFPEGWAKDMSPADASLITVLLNKGVEAGYLEQRPGGEVEARIEMQVEGLNLVGFVDHRTKVRVEDHKTSKNARYLKGPKGLRDSIQMQTYAKERLDAFTARGEPLPPLITLAHNQFVKDAENPIVKRAEAEVTPAEIEAFWNDTIRPLARAQKETAVITNPFDLDDPPPKACRAFGGCPYLSVCAGSEDALTYKRRITSILNRINSNPAKAMTEEPQPQKPSDFLSERLKRAAAVSGQPAINPPTPQVSVVQAPSQIVPSATQGREPPWYNPGCPMCAKKKPGFNLALKKPCRICVSITKVATDAFEWNVADDGSVTWWSRGQKVAEVEAPAPVVDAGSKVSFSADDLYEELKGCKSAEGVMALCAKAEGLLEPEDLEIFMETSAKRIEALTEHPATKKRERKNAAPKPVADALYAPRTRETATGVETGISPSAETVVVDESPTVTAAQVEAIDPKPVITLEVVTGLCLMIGCAPIKSPPGWSSVFTFAEDLLTKLVPGYWKDSNAFDRRATIRNILSGKEVPKLPPYVIQQGRDPDVDNLISALIPHASLVIRGTVQ